jgi:hypothetical protein
LHQYIAYILLSRLYLDVSLAQVQVTSQVLVAVTPPASGAAAVDVDVVALSQQVASALGLPPSQASANAMLAHVTLT